MPSKKEKQVQQDPIVVLNDIYQVKLSRMCMVLQKKISQDGSEELSKEEQAEGYKTLGYFSTWEYLGTILSRDIQRDKALKKGKISTDEFIQNLKDTFEEIQKMFKTIDSITNNKK